MIPSMAAFGGWGGFLGLRAVLPLPALTLGQLRSCTQLFPDTASVEHAGFVRNPLKYTFTEQPLLVRPQGAPLLKTTVGLVGGGIANTIAAYELARAGVPFMMIDRTPKNPAKPGSLTLGGRLATTEAEGYVAELGAAAFPTASPLLWHYVWRWAVSTGMTEAQADQLDCLPLPAPGVVPTRVCYQGEWFHGTTNFPQMPPIIREAALLFRDWLLGLNNNRPQPTTIYLPDAIAGAKFNYVLPSPALRSFWQEMKRRYDGRSFASVLGTEVFAKGSNPASLLSAFAAVGVGTGGFGPVYDIACLEVLRNVLWDFQGLYQLPVLKKSEESEGSGESGGTGVQGAMMAEFVQGLAMAAYTIACNTFPNLPYDDVFIRAADVVSLTPLGQEDGHKTQVTLADKRTKDVDLTIVGISSRAMQAMGLGRDSHTNPFNTQLETPGEVLTAINSVQVAVRRLNMTSSYKAFARIPPPGPTWPDTPPPARPYQCFVTDRFPRLTYLMGPQPTTTDLMLVAADAWGDDAQAFAVASAARRREMIASAFDAQDDPNGTGPVDRWRVVGDAIRASADFRDRRWTLEGGFGGGVKLDRPEDDYLAGVLYHQARLVRSYGDLSNPALRTFFAGDSVGHLGGWAEGAAMSALMATTAALWQVRAIAGESLSSTVRSEALLDPMKSDFTFKQISRDPSLQPRLPAVQRVVGLADGTAPETKAMTWRPRPLVINESATPPDRFAISQSGRHLLTRKQVGLKVLDELSSYVPDRDAWERMALPTPPLTDPTFSVAVSPVSLTPHGLAVSDGKLWHCTNPQYVWRNPVLDGTVLDGAIAVAPSAWAYVVASAKPKPNALPQLYLGRRNPDGGSWPPFALVPQGKVASKVAITADLTPRWPARDFLTIAVIDNQGEIWCRGLATTGGDAWTPWVSLGTPTAADNKAIQVAILAGTTPGRSRVVALFDDDTVYQRLVDVQGPGQPFRWRPVGWPAASNGLYTVSALALGASPNVCDQAGSATLLTASTITNQDTEEQHS